MAFKVACVQFAPQKAEVDKNLDTIAEAILQAQDEGAELVLLPEACTSGYFLEGGVLESSLTSAQLQAALWKRVAGKITRPIDVVLGFYENAEGTLYNAALYTELSPKGPRHVGTYRKFFLPTYGVFDEERFVSRGRDLGVYETRLGKIGILICEDVWHGVLPTLCAVHGAQLILIPAASPARGFSGERIENHDRYRRLFVAVAEEHGVYCASAQLCGFEGGKGFIGGSKIVDPTGQVVVEAPVAEGHMIIGDIDTDLVAITRAQSPLLSDLQSAWSDIRRLVGETDF
ncbi:nitrilase-related carbon-nitrogen hydrolase [Fimbriimonas ginsengisoli]|uniref:Beta-ureidopropionase n=1 Tax=Fimbriimonas ginsengisoli Gsoil 348 TaxID=661478 RepID=A0A068NKS6_FIMGI|nr:nitrilase-related carbon-nitrogen hydrolase [Fimbriimonas ginsengisoli]AIE84032.1 beta-ureidopropionase [Fimbriimonas ginsengisoli Gsoil 348]